RRKEARRAWPRWSGTPPGSRRALQRRCPAPALSSLERDLRGEVRHDEAPHGALLVIARQQVARVQAERLRRALARVVIGQKQAEPESEALRRRRAPERRDERAPRQRGLVDRAALVVFRLHAEEALGFPPVLRVVVVAFLVLVFLFLLVELVSLGN